MTTPTSSVAHEIVIPAEQAGQRLDPALASLLPDYSRSRLKGWKIGPSHYVNQDLRDVWLAQ